MNPDNNNLKADNVVENSEAGSRPSKKMYLAASIIVIIILLLGFMMYTKNNTKDAVTFLGENVLTRSGAGSSGCPRPLVSCGSSCMDPNTQFCCGGKIGTKGDRYNDPTSQFCCGGKICDSSNGTGCCNGKQFDESTFTGDDGYQKNLTCCGGIVGPVGPTGDKTGTTCCNNSTFKTYGPDDFMCNDGGCYLDTASVCDRI